MNEFQFQFSGGRNEGGRNEDPRFFKSVSDSLTSRADRRAAQQTAGQRSGARPRLFGSVSGEGHEVVAGRRSAHLPPPGGVADRAELVPKAEVMEECGAGCGRREEQPAETAAVRRAESPTAELGGATAKPPHTVQAEPHALAGREVRRALVHVDDFGGTQLPAGS